MPAKSQWLLRIPEIVASLSELEVPVVDRAICERLFRVRRRRAIELIQHFGGYRSGNTVLVDRLALIRQLNHLNADSEVDRERRRKAETVGEIGRSWRGPRLRPTSSSRPSARRRTHRTFRRA